MLILLPVPPKPLFEGQGDTLSLLDWFWAWARAPTNIKLQTAPNRNQNISRRCRKTTSPHHQRSMANPAARAPWLENSSNKNAIPVIAQLSRTDAIASSFIIIINKCIHAAAFDALFNPSTYNSGDATRLDTIASSPPDPVGESATLTNRYIRK